MNYCMRLDDFALYHPRPARRKHKIDSEKKANNANIAAEKKSEADGKKMSGFCLLHSHFRTVLVVNEGPNQRLEHHKQKIQEYSLL